MKTPIFCQIRWNYPDESRGKLVFPIGMSGSKRVITHECNADSIVRIPRVFDIAATIVQGQSSIDRNDIGEMNIVDATSFDQIRTLEFDELASSNDEHQIHHRTPYEESIWEECHDCLELFPEFEVLKRSGKQGPQLVPRRNATGKLVPNEAGRGHAGFYGFLEN